MEQILDDPSLNTPEWLNENAKRLAALSDKELKKFGEAGKGKKAELEEAEIEKIMEKYRVK